MASNWAYRTYPLLVVLVLLGFSSAGWGQIITTVAGGGVGDNGQATQATQVYLYSLRDVAVDVAGHLYIADGSNHRVRRVDTVTGLITTVAGNGQQGYSGDGGPAPQRRTVIIAGTHDIILRHLRFVGKYLPWGPTMSHAFH